MRTGLKTLTAAALAATALAGLAAAAVENPWMVHVRGIGVLPDASASVTVLGGSVDIDDAFVPEVDIGYFFTENLSAELIAATAEHCVTHTPTGIDLGCVWLLPPTLTLKYHFAPGETFNPYVGAGVNYTLFYNVNDLNAPILDVDYENRFGFALQAGFDWKIGENLYFNVDVKKLFLSTEAVVRVAPATIVVADVDIDPWIVGIGLGWRF
jgi:outer membrane protein